MLKIKRSIDHVNCVELENISLSVMRLLNTTVENFTESPHPRIRVYDEEKRILLIEFWSEDIAAIERYLRQLEKIL